MRRLRYTGYMGSTTDRPGRRHSGYTAPGGGRAVLFPVPGATIIHPLFCDFCLPATGLVPSVVTAPDTGARWGPLPICTSTTTPAPRTSWDTCSGRPPRAALCRLPPNGQTAQTAGLPRTPASPTHTPFSPPCSGCACPPCPFQCLLIPSRLASHQLRARPETSSG